MASVYLESPEWPGWAVSIQGTSWAHNISALVGLTESGEFASEVVHSHGWWVGAFHLAFCRGLSVFIGWGLVFPRLTDPKENKAEATTPLLTSEITLLCFAISYWFYKPALSTVGGTTQGHKNRRQEPQRTVLEAGYSISSALLLWIRVSNIHPHLKSLSQGKFHHNSLLGFWVFFFLSRSFWSYSYS